MKRPILKSVHARNAVCIFDSIQSLYHCSFLSLFFLFLFYSVFEFLTSQQVRLRLTCPGSVQFQIMHGFCASPMWLRRHLGKVKVHCCKDDDAID